MTAEERIRVAGEFSTLADQFLAAGNSMVGAEMLWGAVTQVIIAIAIRRGEPIQDHQHRRQTIRNLTGELNDVTIRRDFGVAQRLHAHFYHNDMSDDILVSAVEKTRGLIDRLLPLSA